MGLSLDGRRVLLTGASGGIGLAVARTLHTRGATVVASARREDVLERLCLELGDRCEGLPADLTERAEVAALPARAGRVEVLVANAGLPASGPLDAFDAGEIDRALDVKLRAPIQLAHSLAPAMVDRGAGRLVLVSSLSGKVANVGPDGEIDHGEDSFSNRPEKSEFAAPPPASPPASAPPPSDSIDPARRRPWRRPPGRVACCGGSARRPRRRADPPCRFERWSREGS